ncbi:hypothetical protein KC19_3G137400 [Ceratodon purpureus]|uniref:Uncharacterized protein n=1 Tax=Ceratodon purpureus TaxID=3225 RepID=A0A8T0IKR5_CERPU|nr:hypothetical protein KC19_3G137400 [Ceratodon purpureus]
MKSDSRRWAMESVIGPSVTAGSVILAMTVVLFWSQMIVVAGPTTAAWLPRMLAQHYTNNDTVGSLLRNLPPFLNITGKVIEELARNGTGPCYEQHTNSTKVTGLPNNVDILTLSTNVVHKFWLHSYTHAGERRCAGGDYYELDLSSPLWKSRPPIEDLQNGTYAVQFMVPDAYAGSFNFSAHLLFDAYHGLDFDGQAFKIVELTASLRINCVTPAHIKANSNNTTASTAQQRTRDAQNLLTLKRCNPATDFTTHEWSGRWTRPVDNDTCTPDAEARYTHCFSNSDNIPCKYPTWCSGNVSSLESVGWSYSAHCTFHIFSPREAWDCLDGRWLFFWGDSNHQDTIRNMLTFILGIQPPPGRDILHFPVDRSFQNWYRNPDNLDQEVRITSHYNGHPEVDANGYGLDSLDHDHPAYCNYVRHFFEAKRYPNTVIMNSGLHDGWRHRNIDAYVKSVENALTYWSELFGNVSSKPLELVYRTTIAPAGAARGMQSNAQKLEVYNRIMTEKVQLRFPKVKLVDEFDMSFPFHFDNNYSDGGHYGRAPGDHGNYYYFVDVMLGHVLLNALCPQ